MNKIWITGRVTKDIELRYTSSQVAVAPFSLAVTRNFKNANGEYESDFVNCIAYKYNADKLKNWVEKGDKIGIEGRLQTRSYQNNEGKNVYVTEVIVENIEFLQPKKKTNDNEPIKNEADPFTDEYSQFGENISMDDNWLD